ncbi:hypothetical protein TPA0908_61100 [Micromonospora sp. AKA38]|nr:hypothetical protein TPA0908_61100 [Micromonospora sp. AKA38]
MTAILGRLAMAAVVAFAVPVSMAAAPVEAAPTVAAVPAGTVSGIDVATWQAGIDFAGHLHDYRPGDVIALDRRLTNSRFSKRRRDLRRMTGAHRVDSSRPFARPERGGTCTRAPATRCSAVWPRPSGPSP